MSVLPHLSTVSCYIQQDAGEEMSVIYSLVSKGPLTVEQLQGRVQGVRWPVKQGKVFFLLIRLSDSTFFFFFFSLSDQSILPVDSFFKLILVLKIEVFPSRLYCQKDTRRSWVLGFFFIYYECTLSVLWVYYECIIHTAFSILFKLSNTKAGLWFWLFITLLNFILLDWNF